MSINSAQVDKASSPLMFDRIARSYDMTNALLSLGRHRRWRGAMAAYLPERESLSVLDLACGTADTALQLAALQPRIASVLGVDLSEGMLALGRDKVHRAGQSARITLEWADALALPCPSGSFDVVTVAFGLRNFSHLPKALVNAHRVLKTEGRLIILEFSVPDSKLVYPFFFLYLNALLPMMGGIMTGDFSAYRYLARTVMAFPRPARLEHIWEQAGFELQAKKSFMFGAVTLLSLQKVL